MAQVVPATSSGDIAVTAGASVSNRPARIMHVTLTPAAALSTAIVYDNAAGAASGTVLARLQAAASGNSATISLPAGVVANLGISIAVTGTGAIATVHYAAE